MPEKLGVAVLELTGDETKLNRDIDNAHKTTQQKIKGIGKTTMKVGGAMTAGLTTPIVAFGKKATDVAGGFETQMNLLEVAAGDTGQSLDTLREAAIRTGADTELVGINAAESAESFTEFYKAGLTTADIFGGEGQLNAYLEENASLTGAIRAAVDLAAASDLDLASASELVSVTMKTYGIDAEEATRITDNYVQAADASVTEVDQMAEAMEDIGPVMAAYGISLEDTNNMLALLSERGIEGSEAGTALRSMFTNLQRPTKSAQEALADANVELYDMDGNLHEMPDIIGQFVAGTKDMTEEQRNVIIQQAAGTEGMRALQTLMAEGTEGWYDMAEGTATAATAQDVATARTKGFEGAMEALEGTIETFMIQAGTPLIENVLTPLIQDTLTPLVERLTEVNPKFLELGLKIAGVAAVAGPLILVLGAIVTALGAVLSPIGLVIVGIGALIAVFVKANGGIQGTADKLGEFADWIQEYVWPVIQSALQTITAFFTEKFAFIRAWVDENMGLIQATFETVMPIIQQIWTVAWQVIQIAVQNTWEMIKGAVNVAMYLILGIIETVMHMIQGDWDEAWTTIKQMVVNIMTAIWEMLRNTLNNILSRFDTDLATLWETISTWATDTWDTITTWISDTWVAITTFLADTLEAVSAWGSDTWESISTWFAEMWNTIDTWVSDTWERVTTFWADLLEDIGTKLDEIWSTIDGWIGDLTDAIMAPYEAAKDALFGGDGAGGLWGTITEWTGSTIEAIKGIWGEKKESLIGAITAPFDAAKSTIESIYNTISGWIDTIKEWGDTANSIKNSISNAYNSAKRMVNNFPSVPSVPGFQSGTPPGGLIFDQPSLIAVAEAGPERVTVEPMAASDSVATKRENHYHLTVPEPIGNIGDLRDTLRLLEMATG